MRVVDALHDVQILGFDTAPIIYFVEANPRYDAVMASIFRSVSQGEISGVTSTITLTEVLIHPLRKGEVELAAAYRALLAQSANFSMIAVNEDVAEWAAELRAKYAIHTPDALQLAAALFADCQAFLTNDHQLQMVTELKILLVDELMLTA